MILLATLPAGLAAVGLLPSLKTFFGPLGFWQCLHVAIFHVAMSLAYVVVYYGLEERSPSMTILAYVADAGQQGARVGSWPLSCWGSIPWRSGWTGWSARKWPSSKRAVIA